MFGVCFARASFVPAASRTIDMWLHRGRLCSFDRERCSLRHIYPEGVPRLCDVGSLIIILRYSSLLCARGACNRGWIARLRIGKRIERAPVYPWVA